MKKTFFILIAIATIAMLSSCNGPAPIDPDESDVIVVGEYCELNSLLWSGKVVEPGLKAGLKTATATYYLFGLPCPYRTEIGDSIVVKGDVYNHLEDKRGVVYKCIFVNEWIDGPQE